VRQKNTLNTDIQNFEALLFTKKRCLEANQGDDGCFQRKHDEFRVQVRGFSGKQKQKLLDTFTFLTA